MFVVISVNHEDDVGNFSERTLHEKADRATRKNVVDTLGEPVKYESFVVDTGHPEGYELHTVYKNGVIAIGNIRKRAVITYLIARPGQIMRYGIWDRALINKAEDNKRRGLNLL